MQSSEKRFFQKLTESVEFNLFQSFSDTTKKVHQNRFSESREINLKKICVCKLSKFAKQAQSQQQTQSQNFNLCAFILIPGQTLLRWNYFMLLLKFSFIST
jgi:hypothetical protein